MSVDDTPSASPAPHPESVVDIVERALGAGKQITMDGEVPLVDPWARRSVAHCVVHYLRHAGALGDAPDEHDALNCFVQWQEWNWQADMHLTRAHVAEMELSRLKRTMRRQRVLFGVLWGAAFLNAIARWVIR